MHPALRILGLILFIPMLVHGGLLAGVAGACGVAGLLTSTGRTGWLRWLSMNRRLRWFYISIIVLFGWFTPGKALVPEAASLSPTTEGLLLGLGRVVVLAVVVGAVVWLLERSRREELVSGLLWLTGPFAGLGFPRERFAVRLALTLETVPRLQPLLAEVRQAPPQAGRTAWAGRARALLERVIREAGDAPCGPMEIRLPAPPRLLDWLILCLWLAPLAGLALWRPV